MADESKLIIENAKWFAKQIEALSPADQSTILTTKDFGVFEKILTNNGLLNSLGLWQGRADLSKARSLGVDITIASGKPSASKEPSSALPGLGAIGAAVGGAKLLRDKEMTYEQFKKHSGEYGEIFAKRWEEEEKKFQKNPNKKRDPNRPASRQDAFDRAEAERHDYLVGYFEKKAKEWSEKNPNDMELAQAIHRWDARKKNLDYTQFDQIRKQYVTNATKAWDQKDPSRRTRDRAVSITQSNEEIHDHIVLHSPKLAKEWAQKYNDPELFDAIERKRQRDEAAAIQNQNRLSKALGRNPTAKIPKPLATSQPFQPNKTPWTPIPVNTFPGSLPPNTLANQGSPNTLKNAQTTNSKSNKSLYARVSYYSPGQIRNRAILRIKNRIANSRAGQAFQKTKLGKISSRFNQISKRAKKFLNPLNYLLNLFKRSLIGSVASAIGGMLSTALSTIAGGILGIAGTVVSITSIVLAKILTGIGISLSSVSLPLVIVLALIIFLIVTIFSIFFSPTDNDAPPEEAIVESPYAGISYFKVGPREVLNGENITYQIGLIHDSREAKCKLEDITFVDAIPPQSTLVEGSELTTGNYRIDSDPEPIVKWKLTENLASSKGIAPMNFMFKITINPEDDVTITNRIYIEGCAAEISSPDDSGDLFEGANSPPTTNDCGNSNYAAIMNTIRRKFGVTAANFGDPLCNFSLDKLKQVLSRFERDPEKVDFFLKIAQCESVGNGPNGYGSSNNTWGHFQMDSSYTGGQPDPFKPWNEEKNSKGDVPWQRQAQNAVAYNNVQAKLNNNFEAWQTAYCFCYYPKYRNNRKLCGDIENARLIQTPAQCNNSCIPRVVNN